ncbi:MAG: hypothetical protein EP349_10555 [Alphaproteobacteria bacterium]|nr:MAG: hypothetical protein EP349_10555 [Alphaproteobacteria bacterium]
MLRFKNDIPAENATLRHDIYGGDVYVTPPCDGSQRLVSYAKDMIRDILNVPDIRRAHLELDEDTFFTRIGTLRRTLYLDEDYHKLLSATLAENGFDPDRMAFDPLRLRVICPDGHLNKKAAPVYFPHRDTWYAHPQCLIVYWTPLDDLDEHETFAIYPEYFDREVPNDSEVFNYDDWIKDGPDLKIGWQKQDSGMTATYPRSAEGFAPGEDVGFSCPAAGQVFIAGAHYHATRPQNTRKIRFSLDARLVHLDDAAANIGAPNADNRSTGDILKDYIKIKAA